MKRAMLYLVIVGLFVVPAYATYHVIDSDTYVPSLTLLTGDHLYMAAGRIGFLEMFGISTAMIAGTSSGDVEGAIPCLPECFDIQQIEMAEVSSLEIFGGKINQLTMTDGATANLSNGDAIRIRQIDMAGFSSLTMSKGHVDQINIGKKPSNPDEIIVTSSRPRADISGGTITQLYAPRPLFRSGVLIWDEIEQKWVQVDIPDEPAITIECLNRFYDEFTKTLKGRWLDGTAFSIQLVDVENISYGPTIDNIEFVQPLSADVYIDSGTCIFDNAMSENFWFYLNYNGYGNTHVTLVDGGKVGRLSAYNGSTVDMQGGLIVSDLVANQSARVSMYGGSVGGMLEVFKNGMIYLFGSDFKVTNLEGVTTDIAPAGLGTPISDAASLVSMSGFPSYYTGTITGKLADGSILNNTFRIAYGQGGNIFVKAKPMAYGPVLVALSCEQKPGLVLKGNPTLTVVTRDTDTYIQFFAINSSAQDALLVQGNASIFASKINIAGDMTVKGSLDYPEEMVVTANINHPIFPDFGLDGPNYEGLPDLCPMVPKTGEALPLTLTGGQWVLQPGYYSAGIVVENATVTLMPGIYHLGGQKANSGLILKEGAVVNGSQVLLHIIGKGQVAIGSNAMLTVSAPVSGDYSGFLFLQSRENTNPAIFRGTANCTGMLYFPANHVQVEGNVYCRMLMADTIELSGDAQLTVNPGLHGE